MPNFGLNALFPRYDEIMEGMGDDPIKAITAKINQSIQGGAVDPTIAAMMGMPGLASIAARGPRVQVPTSLETELGGGFGVPQRGSLAVSEATPRIGRTAAGGDIPSWDAVASTEAPSGRNYLGELIKRLTSR